MTPWQLHLCHEAHMQNLEDENEARLYFSWHGAAMQRTTKFPKLRDLIRPKKEAVAEMADGGIIAQMKAHAARQRG